MNSQQKITLTSGSLGRNILLFSIPLMLSNVLQVLFNMSDIAVVGRFAGSHALGSVGSTSILVTLFTGFLIGVGSGKIERGAFRRAIESGSRLDLGVTAPAHGLTLMEVFYQDRCVQEDAQ